MIISDETRIGMARTMVNSNGMVSTIVIVRFRSLLMKDCCASNKGLCADLFTIGL